jgi:hypothetical protein
VRFEFAVDLEKGFEYRVVEYDDSGDATKGDWVAVDDWTGILDVTREVDAPSASDEDTDADEE